MDGKPSEERAPQDRLEPGGSTSEPASPLPTTNNKVKPLRVWPAGLLVIALWSLRLVPQLVEETSVPLMMAQFMGPLVCAGLIALWWLLLSRATMMERIVGTVSLLLILVATHLLADKSVKGFGILIFALPWGITAFAVALIASRSVSPPRRMWLGLLAALIGFGFWDLVRTDEIRADFQTTRRWRWQPSPEDQFLEKLASREPVRAALDSDNPLGTPEWPAFRGPHRDGKLPGVVLDEDWKINPPRELWRVAVGPGWSSFSVAGDRLFTQEQRGDDEVIICYDARNGKEVWTHAYDSRFWEVVGGAGPRATPTLSQGQLFALGANGILHCLDAATGDEVWRQDISQDAGREPPTWGFSSSPLVTHGVVIVHAGGSADKGVLAYDKETGELRWSVAAGDHSYSSPQLTDILGKGCVLTLTNNELTIVDPSDGTLLGEHVWEYEGYRVVQPLVLGDSSVLMGSPMGTGTRRIDLQSEGDEIASTECWTSRRMNPYYNDYVAHKGYLYGFDHNIFACVDLEDGERKWKKGRYGNGQVLLLPDADQLLVTSEDGELVLLRATPEGHTELARHRVLDGRTWNHPVLVGNRLFVRNAEEAACFEMPLKDSPPVDASVSR